MCAIILPYVVYMLDANSVCGYDSPLLSYLLLHFYAVDFIEDEASVNGNVCSSRSECGRCRREAVVSERRKLSF